LERPLPNKEMSVASEVDGQEKEDERTPQEYKSTLRIGASGPTTRLASLHYGTAHVMLYYLNTARCITYSCMNRAEVAYRNAQYEVFGIKAR